MSEQKVPDSLYHYTTIKSLQHIFKENGKVALRLTDFRFLNDAEEGFFLSKIVKKNRDAFYKKLYDPIMQRKFNEHADFIEEQSTWLQERKTEVYLMSFTELEDSMQFWRQDYAKDKGLCLKLNTSIFKVPNKSQGTVFDYNNTPVFSKIRYSGINDSIDVAIPELKKRLEEFSQAIRDDVACKEDPLPIETGLFDVKNRVWRSEAEWRMKVIHFTDWDTTIGNLNVEYNIDDLGIPRATIEMDNPFVEIILGPTFSPQYIDSIKKWLEGRGFSDIIVRCGDGVLNW